jgi:hypothetical protein
MNRTRRQVRRWPMVMIRRPLPHGARKRASYVEGCAAACGDAPRGFVLPKHLNLMSSDAGNRARSAGLMIVFTDPDDAVTQR